MGGVDYYRLRISKVSQKVKVVGGWWSGGGGCLLSKLEGSQEKGYGNSHEKLW